MPTAADDNADKQAGANARIAAEVTRIEQENANYLTTAEREKMRRLALYFTHKERGTLASYYNLYPMERERGRGR